MPKKELPRVAMFAPAFAPNFFSEALVNSKLALSMLDAGWDVTVFAAPSIANAYSSGWEEPWSRLQAVRRDTEPARAGLNGASARVGAAVVSRHPVPGALWASRTAAAAVALHARKRFDLVLSRSTSCIAHLPAMLFRKRVGRAPIWIANWNDPPGHRFPAPYDFPSTPLQRVFADRYLRAAARDADVNSFPSRMLRDYLAVPLRLDAEGNSPLRRGIVVPHVGLGWQPKNPPTSDPRVFRIIHAGNLSQERNPVAFFRALARFAERHRDIKCILEIIGRIDPDFEAAAANLGIGNLIRTVSGLPYLECLKRLAHADLQLLIEAPCDPGVFLPSKLTDYFEVGRPIFAISPRVGVVRELIDASGFGVAAASGVEAEIDAALETCFAERDSGGASHPRLVAMENMRDSVRPGRILAKLLDVAEQAREWTADNQHSARNSRS